jgi:DeoR family fructose operon transcriptional repressor
VLITNKKAAESTEFAPLKKKVARVILA